MVEIYHSLSGLDEEYCKFAIRCGINIKDSKLPKRLFYTYLLNFLEKQGFHAEKKRATKQIRIYGIELKNFSLDSL
jgi:hypothetical protein